MGTTGRREVAEAVAAVSGLVTVTLLGGDNFVTTPANLFLKTFDDPQVGIDNLRMSDFREALQGLLQGEGIDEAINNIPDNASITIGQAASIVSAALSL